MGDPVASIRIEAGPHAGSTHAVCEGGVIGRLSTCAVPLPKDDEVSRRHATIEIVSGSFRLRDLASRNGTTCNGEPVDDAPLQDGDLIEVGGSRLRFEMGSAEPAAATKAALRDGGDRDGSRGRKERSRSSRRRGGVKLRASEVALFLALLVLVYLCARTMTDIVLIVADRARPG